MSNHPSDYALSVAVIVQSIATIMVIVGWGSAQSDAATARESRAEWRAETLSLRKQVARLRAAMAAMTGDDEEEDDA